MTTPDLEKASKIAASHLMSLNLTMKTECKSELAYLRFVDQQKERFSAGRSLTHIAKIVDTVPIASTIPFGPFAEYDASFLADKDLNKIKTNFNRKVINQVNAGLAKFDMKDKESVLAALMYLDKVPSVSSHVNIMKEVAQIKENILRTSSISTNWGVKNVQATLDAFIKKDSEIQLKFNSRLEKNSRASGFSQVHLAR